MTEAQYTSAMRRALALAERSPRIGANPQVGCVILAPDGSILAEGYHHGEGTAHAEVDALSHLPNPDAARGATLVVNLEPCRHWGRTPPCVEAIRKAGITTVVYSTDDPSDQGGGGAVLLRQMGITVVAGVLQDDGERLNGEWLTAIRRGLPFVTAKFATSLDGRAAAQDGSSQWITGVESRLDAHLMRSQVDAIIVGTGTVIVDDPALTARKLDNSLYEHQPIPTIVGSRPIPPQARVFQASHKPLIFDHHSPWETLRELYGIGCRRVLVEGGPTLVSSFVGDSLVNRYVFYLGPKLLGGWRVALTQIGVTNIDGAWELEIKSVDRLGPDIKIVADPIIAKES